MTYTAKNLEHLATDAAISTDLPVELVQAVVEQESGWNVWAWNPEPRYRYLMNVKTGQPFRVITEDEIRSKIPPADFPALAGDRDQEWWGQQASWGLMQIMGAVAREYGFKGHYLPEILIPEINMRFGCMHLRKKMSQTGWDIEKGLLRYNGGGNKNYAQEVMERMKKYRGDR